MQTDGNFVVYNQYNAPIWWTGTQYLGPGPAFITQQDDGNLVICTNFVWGTDTCTALDEIPMPR